MTCIVGLVEGDTVWLGGDRAATDGGLNRTLIKEPKIFEKGGIGFGVCGLPKVMDAIQHTIEIPSYSGEGVKSYLAGKIIPTLRKGLKKLECTQEHHGQHYFQGALLIACRGRLFEVQGNFQLVEASVPFAAVGSGAEPALGSLRSSRGNPKERLLLSLTVSAENNAGVAAPFDVIEIKSTG